MSMLKIVALSALYKFRKTQIQYFSNSCTGFNVYTLTHFEYFHILVEHVSILQDHHQGLTRS
jgi:hypothetical protein